MLSRELLAQRFPTSMRLSAKNLLIVLISSGILIFSLLYLLAISTYWNITPDSAMYVMAGESIANGAGYHTRSHRVPLFPPMTSLVFSLCVLLFPQSYFALNVVVAILTLCSLLLAFILFKYELKTHHAFLIVLMSLGSTALFLQSTLLLSEIIYLFFSLLALVVIRLSSRETKSLRLEILVGITLLAACMTRIVGLALVAAMIVSILISWATHRVRPSAVRITMLLAVVAVVSLWEYSNMHRGISYFKLFFQNEPWFEEAGYMSPVVLVTRSFQNLGRSEQIVALFSNGILEHFGYVPTLFIPLAMFFFLVGLFISLKDFRTVTPIYTAIYLWVIATWQGDEIIRHLILILPFLLYYSFLGIEFVKDKTKSLTGPVVPALISAAAGCYVVAYLGFGLTHIISAIPEQHQSPFGTYLIKYRENYDTQRLAIWLKDHSNRGDSYVTQHADMMDIITERRGYNLPLSENPKELLDLLRNKKIHFVLADKKKTEVQKYLLPVIATHPDEFSLIKDEKDASLYQVSLQ